MKKLIATGVLGVLVSAAAFAGDVTDPGQRDQRDQKDPGQKYPPAPVVQPVECAGGEIALPAYDFDGNFLGMVCIPPQKD